MNISYRPLFKLIKEKGLLQKDVWEKAHLSGSSCQSLRNNQCVTTDILVRLCEVLECNIGDIAEVIREGKL